MEYHRSLDYSASLGRKTTLSSRAQPCCDALDLHRSAVQIPLNFRVFVGNFFGWRARFNSRTSAFSAVHGVLWHAEAFERQAREDALTGIAVSSAMRDEFGTSGMLAPWGGEEFAVLFEGVPLEEARRHCERLRLAIELLDCSKFAPGWKLTISGAGLNFGAWQAI